MGREVTKDITKVSRRLRRNVTVEGTCPMQDSQVELISESSDSMEESGDIRVKKVMKSDEFEEKEFDVFKEENLGDASKTKRVDRGDEEGRNGGVRRKEGKGRKELKESVNRFFVVSCCSLGFSLVFSCFAFFAWNLSFGTKSELRVLEEENKVLVDRLKKEEFESSYFKKEFFRVWKKLGEFEIKFDELSEVVAHYGTLVGNLEDKLLTLEDGVWYAFSLHYLGKIRVSDEGIIGLDYRYRVLFKDSENFKNALVFKGNVLRFNDLLKENRFDEAIEVIGALMQTNTSDEKYAESVFMRKSDKSWRFATKVLDEFLKFVVCQVYIRKGSESDAYVKGRDRGKMLFTHCIQENSRVKLLNEVISNFDKKSK